MGEKTKEVAQKELISDLNKILATEWLGFYHYWIASKIVTGPLKIEAQRRFIENAGDELEHAHMVAERIIQLKGLPLLDIDELKKNALWSYNLPRSPNIKMLLDENIDAEVKKIDFCNKVAGKIKSFDRETFDILSNIVAAQILHEELLQELYKKATMQNVVLKSSS